MPPWCECENGHKVRRIALEQDRAHLSTNHVFSGHQFDHFQPLILLHWHRVIQKGFMDKRSLQVQLIGNRTDGEAIIS